ncbi:MAG: response regulator transcription factor [Candidatus Riflebacteria bacterium]|nr:response regulator transcription factor [Candidatus Riflebacteria bacterium]
MTMDSVPDSPRLIICDDHPMLRAGTRLLLENHGFLIVGEAASPTELLPLLNSVPAEMLLVDLTFRGEDAAQFIPSWRAKIPSLKILVYSMHDQIVHVERSLAAGAHGFVGKSDSAEVLCQAIKEVLSGGLFISPTVNQDLQGWMDTWKWKPALTALSKREQEILGHLGRGESLTKISESLNISRKTVETYLGRLKEKLHLETNRELLQFAIELSKV